MCRCFLMTSNWGRRPIRRRPLRICSILALLWVDALLCFGVFQNCPGSLRASGQAVPYGESEEALMQTFVLFRSVQCLLNHVNMRCLRCSSTYSTSFPCVLRSKLQQMSNAFAVAQQEICQTFVVGNAAFVHQLYFFRRARRSRSWGISFSQALQELARPQWHVSCRGAHCGT